MKLRPIIARTLYRWVRLTPIAFASMVLAACSSGGSSSTGDGPADLTSALPGQVPVIDLPLVELDPEVFTPPAAANMNLYDTLVASGIFTRMLALFDKAGTADLLKSAGTITLFAPTDDAFANLDVAIGEGVLDTFTTAELSDRLSYHAVTDNALSSTSLRALAGKSFNTGNGQPVGVSVNASGEVMINNATVTSSDNLASNGILHIIDTVLTPPVRITDPNENIPPPTTTDISSLLLEQSDYSVLLLLIEQAGMAELLQQDNGGLGWTLFAPSDDGFSRSEEDVFELDTEGATRFVQRHLYPGRLLSADIAVGELIMSDGSVDVVRDAETGLSVGGARIVGRDREVGNGIIHYVDRPLVPADNQGS